MIQISDEFAAKIGKKIVQLSDEGTCNVNIVSDTGFDFRRIFKFSGSIKKPITDAGFGPDEYLRIISKKHIALIKHNNFTVLNGRTTKEISIEKI